MTEKRTGRTLALVAVSIAAILGLYVGVYYSLVFHHPEDREHPLYQFQGNRGPTFRRIFAPIHWVDRYLIRSNYWRD